MVKAVFCLVVGIDCNQSRVDDDQIFVVRMGAGNSSFYSGIDVSSDGLFTGFGAVIFGCKELDSHGCFPFYFSFYLG